MKNKHKYFNRTFQHRSIVKRFAHQTRVNVGIGLLENICPDTKILDFGCGKGYFIQKLKEKHKCEIVGYDKYLETDNKLIYNSFDPIDCPNSYDYFTIFETLEHCLEEEQIRILSVAHKQLKDEGKVIVSVPIEIGPIALLKNMFRLRSTLAKNPEFNFINILKCVFYNPPIEFRKSQKYPGHFGFDHRVLNQTIINSKMFKIEKLLYSPFNVPTIGINSQVFFVLKKNSLD